MLFSQRKGIKPAIKEQQIESVDDELRNRLWNILKIYLWDNSQGHARNKYIKKSNFEVLTFFYWHDFFKTPLDRRPINYSDVLKIIRSKFFEFEWYRVYDFLEFTIYHCPVTKIPNVKNNIIWLLRKTKW